MNKYGSHFVKLFSSGLATLAIACSGIATAQQNTPLEACYVEGLQDRLMCGSVSQPLSKNSSSEKVEIHFAVIPAIKQLHPNEAVLAFAGGPGQSAIEVAAIFARNLKYARENRDIILVDQRGTGKSQLLQCDSGSIKEQFAFDDQALSFITFTQEETNKCKAQLQVDLSNFTTVAAASDFEAVRIALGYDKLHLYGASYGTRIAQEYLRQYPESVASATLDGVVPMQQSLVAIGDAIDGALNEVFLDCMADNACLKQYPTLANDYAELIASLKDKPITVKVRHPRTFEEIKLVITESKLRGAVRMALYSHTTRSLIPLVIDSAKRGNYSPLAGLLGNETTLGGIAMGMHSAITCGEDWPNLTEPDRIQYSQSYFGKMMIESLDAICPIWQVEPVDESFYKPVKTDLPILLLSGGLDPATPPSWAELAMVNLSNAKHLVAPSATHGVAAQTCANKVIGQFINTLTFSELTTDCLDKDNRKQYFMNINGPVANQSKGKTND
ncbi:alpha/beta hydrolase [Pseudoalteromonas obscura]|uniref:Proline iminopeptidase n=1 Tax=Pseudoalteromonas obscura TaxID=3048491 RepID=A0ABT7EEJ2_9GAMM|nr:alpha/beta hydrolase [Pseudoalteromonas sp. P94(2023)]MDK2593695.1 alpha/beta hydrolase [Pseudoalteromonas sp. P94(2023)]